MGLGDSERGWVAEKIDLGSKGFVRGIERNVAQFAVALELGPKKEEQALLQGPVFKAGNSAHLSSRKTKRPIAAAPMARLIEEIQVRSVWRFFVCSTSAWMAWANCSRSFESSLSVSACSKEVFSRASSREEIAEFSGRASRARLIFEYAVQAVEATWDNALRTGRIGTAIRWKVTQ